MSHRAFHIRRGVLLVGDILMLHQTPYWTSPITCRTTLMHFYADSNRPFIMWNWSTCGAYCIVRKEITLWRHRNLTLEFIIFLSTLTCLKCEWPQLRHALYLIIPLSAWTLFFIQTHIRFAVGTKWVPATRHHNKIFGGSRSQGPFFNSRWHFFGGGLGDT